MNRAAEPMQSYLVEAYVPSSGEAACNEAAARARAVTEELSSDGSSVRYVRSIFVAEDETCFHMFEATSKDAVAAVSRRAGIDAARIVCATLDEHGQKEAAPAGVQR
jgi:hypothetical protein